MAQEQPETDPFLAMLEMRIAKLTALAEVYRDALSTGALGSGEDLGAAPFIFNWSTPTARATGNAPVEMPTGAFRNMGMAEAIRVYLGAVKRKTPAKQIGVALREGGLASTAANFDKTLVTTMHRMKANGELLQFAEGWDLASAYPESLRTRITKEAKPPKSGKTTRRGPQRKGFAANVKAKPKAAKADAAAGPKPVPSVA
jgi:hypothetical protein